MYNIISFIRKNLNRAGLSLYGAAFPILSESKRKWLFEKSAEVKPFASKVRIIKEDYDSVTIGKFETDGSYSKEDFRILSTTDFHLGDDPFLRTKAFTYLSRNIQRTKPDLVIFTGDIVLSKFQILDAVQFARFMEKIGVYWAITFGNHEAREEKGYFKRLMIDMVRHYPHCLMRYGDDKLYGYGNMQINIMKSENEMLRCLYLFDSGRDIRDRLRKEYNIPEDMKGYDFIKKEQIVWYENKTLEIQKHYGDIKSMMYFHIPIPEYKNVMDLQPDGTYIDSGKSKILFGSMFESVGCSTYNSGLFDKIKELHSTDAIYCGHDHVNDFCAKFDDVYLIYNQCCGYETYTMKEFGFDDEKDWIQGVTITDIAQNAVLSFHQYFNRDFL